MPFKSSTAYFKLCIYWTATKATSWLEIRILLCAVSQAHDEICLKFPLQCKDCGKKKIPREKVSCLLSTVCTGIISVFNLEQGSESLFNRSPSSFMITPSPVQSQRPPVHLVKWAASLWYVLEFFSHDPFTCCLSCNFHNTRWQHVPV